MGLPEWLMIVDIDLDPSIEVAWNDWYDDVHLADLLECPGFERATRFIAPEPDEAGRLRNMTIYELSDAEAMATPEFASARGLGPFAEQATARTRRYRRHIEVSADELDAQTDADD